MSQSSVRVRVFIAISLDGFIARPDGSIDWLTKFPVPDGQDFGYTSFFQSVDAIIMGSGTFETVRTFDSWPYANKKVIVMSHRTIDLGGHAGQDIKVVSESPRELVIRLSGAGFQNIYVDGGKVIQSFLREGLIDEMILTRLPLLIGKGRPLFGDLPGDLLFEHRGTVTFDNGFVQSTYGIPRK